MKTKAISRNGHDEIMNSHNNKARKQQNRSSPSERRFDHRSATGGISPSSPDDLPEIPAARDKVEKPPSPGLVYSYLIDGDDHRRAAVHRMISGRSDMVVRSYRDRDAFLAEAHEIEEGCVLLFDHGGGREGGQSVASFIRGLRESQRFACVMLATERDIRAAIEAMKAGATDCLLYPCDAAEIVSSVDEALVLVREAARRNATLAEARRQIDRLTSREQDVLLGLMHGKSNKMIALDLAISPRTVEIYRANLMEKLGTRSLSETLKVAFAAGFS